MPKFHGYRQLRPFNSYDAFSPREILGHEDGLGLPVFDDKNLGRLHLTNLCVARSIVAADETAIIGNWYARTNFPTEQGAAQRAWDAFTQVTTVTMVMGIMPVRTINLADLLRRVEGQRDTDMTTVGEQRSSVEHMAKLLWLETTTVQGVRQGLPPSWDDLTADQKHSWWLVAHRARFLMGMVPPVICPIRQSLYAHINTERRALRTLLEVMPNDISPQLLTWIHLEGIAVHEVRW
jgi:hypothetical protein